MSDDKQNKKSGDMARRIWLAGIGAYGKAFEEGRDMMRGVSGNLSGKTSDAFESLAEKGEKLEMAAKVKGAQLAGKASDLGDELQSNLAIDDRIQAMRDRLSSSKGDDRIAALEARLAAMEAKLDLLIKQTAKPKRATTQKTTTTRTRKAPAKKAPVKKTTTKKTPAKKPAAKK